MADTVVPLGHEEPSAEATHLRHHFATPEQQMEASTLGMWTFLITEVLFFGGMFTSYAIYRGIYSRSIRQHQPVHGRGAGWNQYRSTDLQQFDHGAISESGTAQQ